MASSLRTALELEPGHQGATLALASLLIDKGETDEAVTLLGRIPETAESRHLLALARLKAKGEDRLGDVTARLDQLLDQVKADQAARQEFLDILEALGPEDPRTARYRREFTSRIF